MVESDAMSVKTIGQRGVFGEIEVHDADAVGERLRAELRRALEAVPADARTPTAFSRRFSVDRVICHRLMSAARVEGTGVDALLAMPGSQGVNKVVDALGRAGVTDAPLRAAVREYETLIARAGGSQANLLRVLRELQAIEACGEDVDVVQTRRRHAHASAAMTGLSADVLYSLCALRVPADGAGEALECALVRGLIGLECRAGHFPIVLSRGSRLHTDAPEGASGESHFHPAAVLASMSTTPAPVVAVAEQPDQVVELLDGLTPGREPHNVFVGGEFQIPDPLAPGHNKRHIVSPVPRVPADRMVLDIYLDRRLDPSVLGRTNVYWVGPEGVVRDESVRWYDRIATLPAISPVETPPDVPGRHGATDELLHRAFGWEADGFERFRLDVRYPIWGAQHVLTFRFNAEHAASD